jgi:hypothetical protein
MILRAKAADIRINRLNKVILRLEGTQHDEYDVLGNDADFEVGRRVKWFSARVRRGLGTLVHKLNQLRLDENELNLIATILSATVREVSYARNDQWKLHRISAAARRRHEPSVWSTFLRRLKAVTVELQSVPALPGHVQALDGDVRNLSLVFRNHGVDPLFDVVLTSPPYGDSRTTVQYGAMSSISLAVVAHLRNIQLEALSGAEIDRECLGGRTPRAIHIDGSLNRRYWNGGFDNDARKRVASYLRDMRSSCRQIARALKPGGVAVFVTSRRRVGGWRLYLDQFIIDTFHAVGLKLTSRDVRHIESKKAPGVINRKGRSKDCGPKERVVVTMQEEQVLVFSKV